LGVAAAAWLPAARTGFGEARRAAAVEAIGASCKRCSFEAAARSAASGPARRSSHAAARGRFPADGGYAGASSIKDFQILLYLQKEHPRLFGDRIVE